MKIISITRVGWEYETASYIMKRLEYFSKRTYRDHHRLIIRLTPKAAILFKFQYCCCNMPTIYCLCGAIISSQGNTTCPDMIMDVAPLRINDDKLELTDNILQWLMHNIANYVRVLLEDHYTAELYIEDNFDQTGQVFSDIVDRDNPTDIKSNSSEWFTIMAHYMRNNIPSRALIKAVVDMNINDPDYKTQLVNEMRIELTNNVLGYDIVALIESRTISPDDGKLHANQRSICTSVDELKNTCTSYLGRIQDVHKKIIGSDDSERINFYIQKEE